MSNNKIYVGNLPYNIDNGGLQSKFEEFGSIDEAVVINDRETGRSKGFGFVTFKDGAAADKAITEMNGADWDGRPLKVNSAKPREDRERGGSGSRY